MNAQTLIKRVYVFVVLGLISVAAYFQARGIVQLLGLVLGKGTVATKLDSARRSTPSEPPAAERPSISPLIFDPTPPVESGAARASQRDPLSWPVCDGLRLVAASESPDATWSLASLRSASASQTLLVRAGERLAERRVAFIGYNPRLLGPAVWLEGTEGDCQAVMFGSAAPKAPSPPTDPEALPSTARSPRAAQLDRAAPLRTLRIVPEMRAGAAVGVRLFGVRPGSLLDTLGIRNGDRLETINGYRIANPEQALTAYARLRTASHLVVHLERHGAPVELDYRID